MKDHRRSLGQIVFARMLAIILAIAVVTFVLFNLLLRVYIRANVSAQLDSMISGLTIDGQDGLLDTSKVEHGAFGIQGNAFSVDSEGSLLDILQGDHATIFAISARMRESQLFREDVRNAYLTAGMGEYYVSCIADKLRADALMVFFVDVTTVNRFFRAACVTVMVVLVLAAVALTLSARSLAGSIQRGVTRLTDYVGKIGMRDFDTPRPEFRERELDNVARALEATAGELKDVQSQQTAFFQNISHELRTPLMSIRCYAEGIACGVMEPAASGETILEETDQLTGMVEDLLYISRMEQGAVQRKMETVDLRDILSECVSAIRHQAERRGIAFEFRFTEEPVWFTCDEREISQMYTNLLSNAIRYAKSIVTLECRVEHSEVRLVVADDGEGLSEQDLPHVFERFYKGRGGQHGIGLSIVKSIVELYGGTIQVKNLEGACFEARLPRR